MKPKLMKHVSYVWMSTATLLCRQFLFALGTCLVAIPTFILIYAGVLLPYPWSADYVLIVTFNIICMIGGAGIMFSSFFANNDYLHKAKRNRKERTKTKINKNHESYSIGSLNIGEE